MKCFFSRTVSASAIVIIVSALAMACATGNCRSLQQQEGESVYVQVYRHDGSVYCGEEGVKKDGRKPGEGKQELEKLGIQVKSAKKSHDGKMHAQVCGGATGKINLFTIPKQMLAKAQAHGFQLFEEGEPRLKSKGSTPEKE